MKRIARGGQMILFLSRNYEDHYRLGAIRAHVSLCNSASLPFSWSSMRVGDLLWTFVFSYTV